MLINWSRSQSESQDSERAVDVEQREEEVVVQRETGSDTAVTSSDDDDDEEEETVGAHSQLLSTISGLGRQKKRGQRSEATPTVSQYQLTSLAGGQCSWCGLCVVYFREYPCVKVRW